MKNLMFAFFLAGILGMLYSCQSENLLPTDSLTMGNIANSTQKEPVAISDLPPVIITHVEQNYAPHHIASAWHVMGSGYEITLENGQLVYFNEMGNCIGEGGMHNGGGMHGNNGGGMHGNGGGMGGGNCNNCMGGDTIPAADLPQTVLDYVSENYPGETIVTVVVHLHGDYSVELSNGTVLMFEEDGEFMHECLGTGGGMHGNGGGMHGNNGGGMGGNQGGMHGNNGGGMGGGNCNNCMGGDTIPAADLPQTVLDYVSENYPGETIVTVVVHLHGDYSVELSNGTVLMFEEDGEFMHECLGTGNGGGWGGTTIPVADLPAAVVAYVTAHYPDASISNAMLKNNGYYFLHLSNGVMLLFDAGGNILFDSGN